MGEGEQTFTVFTILHWFTIVKPNSSLNCSSRKIYFDHHDIDGGFLHGTCKSTKLAINVNKIP